MVTVAGEALMDVVVGPSGALTAFPGGAPFNVARTVARLGGECQYLGRLSADAFGRRLYDELEMIGYLAGTSAARLRPEDVPDGLLAGGSALVLGGLGLTIDPTAETLLALVDGRPPGITTMLDPNCRPAAIGDLAAYRRTVGRLIEQVELVKVSVEDLELLEPGSHPLAVARAFLARGPGAVLVTDGPAPVRVLTAGGEGAVAAPEVDVVDTIGAGDAFVAGFLTWWTNHGLTRSDVGDRDALLAATQAAVEVAAAGCTVPGAGLPADFAWAGS